MKKIIKNMNKEQLKKLDTLVRWTICLPFTVVFTPLYTLAYGIANLFRLAEYDDMINPIEFATLWADKYCMVIYPYYEEMVIYPYEEEEEN